MEPKRLIFQGRILNKDNEPLKDCKLKDGLTVVVQAAPTAASTAPSPAAATSPAAAAAIGLPSPSADATATQRQAGVQALAGGLGAGLAGGGMRATINSPMVQAVATVRGHGQPAGVARECLTTLTKIIDNIVANPTDEKYRKIKRANAGFRRKVGCFARRL